jgi:mannosyltransferase OCH1-like enzyme
VIPRIIHQIWLGGTDGLPEPPPQLAEASASWGALHPAWEHRVWTGIEVEELFARARPHLLALYRRYPYWVQRSDAGRYLILHEHGGVYADFDIACARPLDALVGEDLVLSPTRPFGVSNDLMMAMPRHPLFRAALGGLPAAYRRWHRPWMPQYFKVMSGTASLHLSRAYRGMTESSPARLLTAGEYGHGDPAEALVRHVTGNSWHRWDARALVRAWTLADRLAAAFRRGSA